MQMRPFIDQDARTIVSWIKDEKTFFQWSASVYGFYPISPQDMIDLYRLHQEDNWFFPFTFVQEHTVIGHLIFRYTNPAYTHVRIGFVIKDPNIPHLGGKMLEMAVLYAIEFLGAQQVDLGVFDNNPRAIACYKKVGFEIGREEEPITLMDSLWTSHQMVYKIERE
ncbi:GNAT family N-acetyltransferase [Dubosiella newyorkensis]|jgi:RimJ/RimL family protein N-acetyltransferase|uniref:GNAT family N-acetyltransferase n=1 Tax=Dubosiella newyorkensis TaxID=1862672 RepID=UPI0023569C28|nr:GNAT family protein [Dubosiella newyorkensis]MCI9040339.1 GNAT family N-acetyltransferase [Dubosiella newyorkensis]